MWLAALRRFSQLLVTVGVPTLVGSILFGLLLGASLSRSIALGFYLVGSFLMIAGFFFGNRGPVRPRGAEDMLFAGLFPTSSRRLRWATRQENDEAINFSAVFVALGFVLILLGVASDNKHALF
jgi:hypothetical protein